MKKALGLVSALTLLISSQAFAATYPGNGSTDFGGPAGTGTLTLTDDGTTVSGTWTKGTGSVNDVLVIYIDSVGGGASSTLNYTDSGDGLRRAISGFDGGTNRSTITFAGGFNPDYAIALGPVSDSFGGLWQLVESGAHNFVSSVSLSPTGNGNSATYTFNFTVANIGLTPNSGAPFNLFGTYVSNSGYRSLETLPGNATGTQGWNPFTQTASVMYGTVPVEISEFSID